MEVEFTINNSHWKIKELSQKEIKEEMEKHLDKPNELGKYYGLTYSDIQTIFLDRDLCEERKRNTLIHELAHCYIETYITHLNKNNYDEEDVADIVANSHDIIKNIVDKYFERTEGE